MRSRKAVAAARAWFEFAGDCGPRSGGAAIVLVLHERAGVLSNPVGCGGLGAVHSCRRDSAPRILAWLAGGNLARAGRCISLALGVGPLAVAALVFEVTPVPIIEAADDLLYDTIYTM